MAQIYNEKLIDLLIENVRIADGGGGPIYGGAVAVDEGRIVGVGEIAGVSAKHTVDGAGKVLSPGFIDTHTHDDLFVLDSPDVLPKLSQGVTTVIVGNCGICAAPFTPKGEPPSPMHLLGKADEFRFSTFAQYRRAIEAAEPAINVAALVGHTALRSNHMDRLDRPATDSEIGEMRAQLLEALAHGALGLSTGLAYTSAIAASTEEVMHLAEPLFEAGGIYTTHMRTEGDAILDAMEEAFQIGRFARSPVLISHIKCAGIDTWGRSGDVIAALDRERETQDISCDCYPYAASSTVLDDRQIDPRVRVQITWSTPCPEMAGKELQAIASEWGVPLQEAAERLKPAGAIYHSMSEDDVRAFLRHPASMIGSDGLPCDPRPHPRLWGTFPRILGYYCREQGLFPLETAIHKMTGASARRFRLSDRGLISQGYWADLVLFDPETVIDKATFDCPVQQAEGIEAVWVAGALTYVEGEPTGERAGTFVARGRE